MVESARAATADRNLLTKKYGGSAYTSSLTCFVYLLYAPRTGLYKIGMSVNVEKRANGLSLQAGIPIEVVDYWELADAAPSTESALHTRFSEYRQLGEWFDFGSMDEE